MDDVEKCPICTARLRTITSNDRVQVGGEWITSRPGQFDPSNENRHLSKGGKLDPKAALDDLE